MEPHDRPPLLHTEKVTSDPILLDQIRHRPGAYLGRATVVGLMHFLDGIEFRNLGQNPPTTGRFADWSLDKFEE